MPEICSELPEVLQYHGPMICPRLDIALHRGSNVSPREVLRAPQDETFGCRAVPSCPPGLLVVSLERRRRTPMQDMPDIRFVDPHAEGAGRDDDAYLIGEKRPKHAPANARAQARVVGSGADTRPEQRTGHELGQPSRRGVDQGPAGRTAHTCPNDREPFAIVRDLLNGEGEIGAVERRDDYVGVRHAEDVEDVSSGRGCRAAGQRDRWGTAQT